MIVGQTRSETVKIGVRSDVLPDFDEESSAAMRTEAQFPPHRLENSQNLGIEHLEQPRHEDQARSSRTRLARLGTLASFNV